MGQLTFKRKIKKSEKGTRRLSGGGACFGPFDFDLNSGKEGDLNSKVGDGPWPTTG